MTKRKARSQDKPDRPVVNAFVSFLSNRGHPGLKVDCWPEDCNRDTKESRKNKMNVQNGFAHEKPPDSLKIRSNYSYAMPKEIDAIAGPFAIEHTSVDTVAYQRRDTDYFKHVVDGIANELRDKVGFRLRITVEWSAVKKGQVWAAIGKALKGWILTTVPSLPDGQHVIEAGSIASVPFGLIVMKASDCPPGVFFARSEPNDRTLSVEDRERLEEHAKKLAKYKPRKITVLLVESSDMALMNPSIMLGALKTAFSNALPTGVDQVWYVDTSGTSGPGLEDFKDFTSDLSQ